MICYYYPKKEKRLKEAYFVKSATRLDPLLVWDDYPSVC